MRILLAFLVALRLVHQPDDPRFARQGGSRSSGVSGGGRTERAARPSDLSRGGVLAALKRVRGEIKGDGVLRLAAAVAFYLALSLVPLAVVAVSLFGLVADPQQVTDTLSSLAALPGGVADLVLEPARDAASAGTGSLGFALVAGLATGLWTASAGTKALMEAIGIAYDQPEGRGFVALRGTALGLTVVLLAFLGGAVVTVALAEGLAASLGLAAWVGQVLRFPVLLLGIAVLLAVLYRFGPDRADARWRWLTPGAVVASVLWLVLTGAFTFYVDSFGSYDESYGSLAGVVVLLLWLQLSVASFLLGAEVNAELERQTAADTTTGPAAPMGQRGAVPADYPPGVEPEDAPQGAAAQPAGGRRAGARVPSPR